MAWPRTRAFLPGPVALLALAIAVPIAVSALKSPDLFFHLAGGRWILAHGFSKTDPFSVTGVNWVPHEWLFGVLAELLVRALGAAGPELLIATLVAAWAFALWAVLTRAAGHAGLPELVVVVLAADATSFTWSQERPYHFAHLFFIIAIACVQAWRAGKARALWWLVPLSILWANTHGSWLLAPVLVLLVAIGTWLETPNRPTFVRSARAVGVATCAFLAAGLSPLGAGTYLYPIHHARLPSTLYINEWFPLDLGVRWSWAYLLLLFIGLWVFANAERRSWGLSIAAAVFGLAALRTMRHVPFAAIVVATLIAEHLRRQRPLGLPESARAAWARLDGWTLQWSRGASGTVLPFAIFVGLGAQAVLHPVAPRDRLNSLFDVRTLEALRELPPGRVLNRFWLGGPISYFAGPDYKVFIDSRNDPFPFEIHEAYRKIIELDGDWQAAIRQYDPDYLEWNRHKSARAVLDYLQQQGGWKSYREDGDFVLWVRDRTKL